MASPPDPTLLVGTMLTSLKSSLASITFTTEGQFLLAALTVIALVLIGIRGMLTNEPFADTIGAFFMTVLTWGMASYIIGINGANGTFLSGLNGGFDTIAGKILGNMNFNETLGAMMGSAFSLFEADSKIWAGLGADTLFNFGYAILNFGMRLFAALFVLLAALIYAGQYLVTQFMILVGSLLAPILVPWIMFKPTEFLFWGWVKFMIIAGLQKVVGAIMLLATTSIIKDANKLAADAGGSAEANFYIYSVVILILGIMAYLMMQATGTAHALVAGGMGMGTFKPPSKLQPGGGSTAVSNSIQGAGGAAAKGGAAAAGGVAGGVAASRAASAAGQAGGIGVAMRGAMAGAKSAGSGKTATMNPIKAAISGAAAGKNSVTNPSGKTSGGGGGSGSGGGQQTGGNSGGGRP